MFANLQHEHELAWQAFLGEIDFDEQNITNSFGGMIALVIVCGGYIFGTYLLLTTSHLDWLVEIVDKIIKGVVS